MFAYIPGPLAQARSMALPTVPATSVIDADNGNTVIEERRPVCLRLDNNSVLLKKRKEKIARERKQLLRGIRFRTRSGQNKLQRQNPCRESTLDKTQQSTTTATTMRDELPLVSMETDLSRKSICESACFDFSKRH